MILEFEILNWIQTIRVPILDKLMVAVSTLGNGGIFWIAVIIVMIALPRTRKVGIAMAVSLLIEFVICNLLIKPAVGRIRPYNINASVELIIAPPGDASFPSGHSGSAFAVVSAMFFAKCRLWIPGLILAVFIAFSRLYLYVHYPSDVLAGIVIGIICGWAGNMLILLIDRKIKERKGAADGKETCSAAEKQEVCE